MYKRTYSLKKLPSEISTEVNLKKDKLFNEIVLEAIFLMDHYDSRLPTAVQGHIVKENFIPTIIWQDNNTKLFHCTSFDGSSTKVEKQIKTKRNNKDSGGSPPAKAKRNQVLQESFDLFKNTSFRKKEIGQNLKNTTVKKKNSVEIASHTLINTLSSSNEADSESSLMIVEENMLSQPNCNPKSDDESITQEQHGHMMECYLTNKELYLDRSIEVARKSSETFRHSARGLDCTPLVELEASDDDSFPNIPVFHSRKKDRTLSEEAWVTLSSDSKGTKSYYTDTGSNRKTMSSKYTYSYVSTYTDGTASSKASSTDRTSPHIFIRKHCPQLNSTTYKNKDDIGTVQFPDFISPVVNTYSSSRNNQMEHVTKWKHQEEIETGLNQKCSTQLFVSISSSRTKMFQSLDLSEIQEMNHTKVPSENFGDQANETKKTERTPSSNNCLVVQPDQHTLQCQVDRDKQKQEFLCSTPHSDNAALIAYVYEETTRRLDLSPIKSPVFENSELPMNYSIEVNTDEIIVPSLEQTSDIEISIVPEKEIDKNEKVHLDSLTNCVERHSTKSFSGHINNSNFNTFGEQLNTCENKHVSNKEFKVSFHCVDIKNPVKSGISTCAPIVNEITRTDVDQDSKRRHQQGSEEVKGGQVNRANDHVVEEQTYPKRFSGCSKCLDFFNKRCIWDLCFVSKLCACSQAELKNQ